MHKLRRLNDRQWSCTNAVCCYSQTNVSILSSPFFLFSGFSPFVSAKAVTTWSKLNSHPSSSTTKAVEKCPLRHKIVDEWSAIRFAFICRVHITHADCHMWTSMHCMVNWWWQWWPLNVGNSICEWALSTKLRSQGVAYVSYLLDWSHSRAVYLGEHHVVELVASWNHMDSAKIGVAHKTKHTVADWDWKMHNHLILRAHRHTSQILSGSTKALLVFHYSSASFHFERMASKPIQNP